MGTLTVADTLIADDLYLWVEQTYEIIDENLPYAERFRTLGYELRITDESGEIDIRRPITEDEALHVASQFLGAVGRMKREPIDPDSVARRARMRCDNDSHSRSTDE